MFSNDCSLGLALTNEHHGCVTPCQYLIASKLTAECGDHNNQKICELAKIPGLVFSGYWPPLTEPTFAHSAALVTQGSNRSCGSAARHKSGWHRQIDLFGPVRPFEATAGAAPQRHRSGHSSPPQHFQRPEVDSADFADLRRTADRLEHRNRCYWSLARAAIETIWPRRCAPSSTGPSSFSA